MKFIKSALMVLLCVCMVLPCISCAAVNRTPVFSYEGNSITSDYYSLILSYQKGFYIYLLNYYNGVDLSANPEYWDTEFSEGKTLAQSITEDINNYCRMLLVSNYLCKKYNLEVTDQATKDAIESDIDDMITNYGGEDLFAIALAQFGSDETTFRNFLYDAEKINILQDYLYGESGIQKVPAADIEKEFLENYKKVDSMTFSFSEYAEDGTASTYLYDYTDEQIGANFLSKYVKADYLFYKKKADEGDDAFEARVTAILNELNAGAEFADKKTAADNSSAGWVFTDGAIGESLMEKVRATENGIWCMAKDDEGWHIFRRAEIAVSDMTDTFKNACHKAMSADYIRDYADKYLADVKSGNAEYGKELDTDFYSVFVPDNIFADEDTVGKEILDAYDKAAYGEYFSVELTSGIFVLYKEELTAADLQSSFENSDGTKSTYYAAIESSLVQTAFSDYLQSFYDSVTLNSEELGKYDIRTAVPFNN